MKHYSLWNFTSWTIYLYEASRLGEEETPPQAEVRTLRYCDNVKDPWPERFKRFINSDGFNFSTIATLDTNEIIFLRKIRPDSLIEMDTGIHEWPKQRLIDDIFILRTHQEHCFMRYGYKWSPEEVARSIHAFIVAMKTPGLLTNVDLDVVWLAPRNKQGIWVNFARRSAVEEVFFKNHVNYRSSYYIQEVEPNEDCQPIIQVRTTGISVPFDPEGYPWILRKWNDLGYWTSWNDETGQVIEIVSERSEPYQQEAQGYSVGQVIPTPTIGDNLPIPNPGWPRYY